MIRVVVEKVERGPHFARVKGSQTTVWFLFIPVYRRTVWSN